MDKFHSQREEAEFLDSKYENLKISKKAISKEAKRLTNQVWKLIPMKENEEDWEKQLKTVKMEIVGLNEILLDPLFLQLLAKLEGLLLEDDIDFELYRKTIFECLSILQGLS